MDKISLKYTGFIISYCSAYTMRIQPLLFFYRKKRINDKEFNLLQYFWASTALAILITMPMVGSMLYFHFNYNNLLFGTLIGFSVHTIVLVFSKRLSSMLINLVSIWLLLFLLYYNYYFYFLWNETASIHNYFIMMLKNGWRIIILINLSDFYSDILICIMWIVKTWRLWPSLNVKNLSFPMSQKFRVNISECELLNCFFISH